MSTPQDILRSEFDESGNTMILRVPYISYDYFFSKKPIDIFEIMDQYFMVDYLEKTVNYNTQLIQAFHNTIDIPEKYYPYIFSRNTNEQWYKPMISISIDLIIDQDLFLTSNYPTLTELDIDLKINIIKYLKENEGFMISFYETDLEKFIFNKFNPIIRNVRVNTPTLFEVNNAAVIYQGIQSNLDFESLLNFIPPFFHYDYSNLKLNISF